MLRILLDNLLENEEKLVRFERSLDIRHLDDLSTDANPDSDGIKDFIKESHIKFWLETKRILPKSIKRTANDAIEKSSGTFLNALQRQ